MKLERLSEYITVAIAIVFGMLVALFVGLKTGGGDSKVGIAVIGGVIAMSVALFLRANIWILIPLFWGLSGRVLGAPGGLSVNHLVILYVFPVFLILKALKVVRTKPQYCWLDYLLLFNLFYLVTVYIRNPVGTDSMGFDRVGGKPYFEAIIVGLAYWVIGHVTISPKLAMKLPVMMVLGDWVTAAGGLIANHVPGGGFLGRVYSEFRGQTGEAFGESPDGGMGREVYLTNAGSGMLNLLYSLYSPFTTLNPLYIWRFLLFALSLFFILKSGFRGALISAGATFILSCYFRGGIRHILRIFLIGVPIAGLFLAAQGTLIDLPPAVQRTLCFLPGKWDPFVKDDAEGSLEWRQDIWRNVWESGDKYISNWWLGDGFGMNKVQLRESEASTDGAENLTVSGDYHSLPLSAIHAVGYVGLVLFCMLIFSMAFYAWKLIGRAKGTPYFPLALLFGIAVVFAPIPSLVLTGFYKVHLIGSIYSIAMLRLIDRSLTLYRREQDTVPVEIEKAFPQLEMTAFPFQPKPNHP